MSTGVLAAVVGAARRAADERARGTGAREAELEAATRHPQPGRFRAALARDGMRIVAECKRRSPSRGILRATYDPVAIARRYEAAGAAAISVLTEPTFFDGHLDHLRAVRASVLVPLLRKDFIVTDFQVMEARAAGADAVLLIVAALGDAELASLLRQTDACELGALVEVHGESELERALTAGADMIGVNSRDLQTLDVSTSVFDRMAASLPPHVVAIAESGLNSAADLRRLRARRYDGFLIGERFMTSTDPGAALAGLLDDVRRGEAS